MANYYVQDQQGKRGPFTPGQLKSMWQRGAIPADAKCKAEGMDRWLNLGEIVDRKQARVSAPQSASCRAPSDETVLRRSYTEEQAYAQALAELDTSRPDPGIWAKAMAFGDGDGEKTKRNYLTYRAQHLCGLRSRSRTYPGWVESFWIPQGRRGRGAWFLWGFAHLGIVGLLGLPFASDDPSPLADLWLMTLGICWVYLTIVNAAKRLHDLNLTSWLAPIVFVPLVPLLFLILSGTLGMNRFGERSTTLR